MRTLVALTVAAVLAAPALAQQPRPGAGFGRGAGASMLLANKGVQDELKLTDEQKEKIKDFTEKARADMPKFDPQNFDREKFAEAMKKMVEATEKFTKEVLTADQNKRLKEISLQQGGVMAAAQNEDLQKTLKLTDEQKDKFKAIAEDLQKELRELRGGGFNADAQKKIADLRKESSTKALAVLTSEQKKQWEEMTGKPFEVKFDGFGGPGGDNKKKGGKKRPPDKDKDGE